MNQDQSTIDTHCHLHAINSLQHASCSPSPTIDEITECRDNLNVDGYQQEDEGYNIKENKHVPSGTRVLINDTKEHKIGQIIKNEISYHYSVDFGDDTYSHDMYVRYRKKDILIFLNYLFYFLGLLKIFLILIHRNL